MTRGIAFSAALALLGLATMAAAASYDSDGRRPAFDKRAYVGTAWSQTNPWWPPNDKVKRSRYATTFLWDYAWDRFSDDLKTMWRQVAERYQRYGLTGLQWEMTSR